MGTSHEHLCAFVIICGSFFLRKRNVSDKSCIENTHFMYRNFFSPENRAVYDIIWKNMYGRYVCECGNEPSGSVKCGEFLD